MTILLLIQLGILSSCWSQSAFQYKKPPAKYFPSKVALQTYIKEANNLITSGYDLSKSLPKNYVTDASKDYTDFIQQAITNNNVVIFPDFPILINSTGLRLRSNSILIFRQNSLLVMKPNSEPTYALLRIFNVQNIKIYFPNLKGDRYSHLGTKGEWGFGIWAMGASNIEIINPKISNFWGDGIDIGGGSDHIRCYYPVLDNNRRNGISITHATNILVESGLISNSNGTPPSCGIDLEPNDSKETLNNITLNNVTTYNNGLHGILVCPVSLGGNSIKNINITINNHTDEGSLYALGLYITNGKNVVKPFTGRINITNSKWIDNKQGGLYQYAGSMNNGLNFVVKNISVLQTSKKVKINNTKRKNEAYSILGSRYKAKIQ